MNDLKVQKASLSFDLSREPQQKLGSKFAFSREIKFPVSAKLSVDAEIGEFVDGNLSDLLCETGTYNLTLAMKKVNCSGAGAGALVASLRGAKLMSQSLKTSIGGNASMSAEFEVSLGGPEDLSRGLYLSGSYL